MGAYPAHGRISMTENGGGHALQCHLALSRNRPAFGSSSPPTSETPTPGSHTRRKPEGRSAAGNAKPASWHGMISRPSTGRIAFMVCLPTGRRTRYCQDEIVRVIGEGRAAREPIVRPSPHRLSPIVRTFCPTVLGGRWRSVERGYGILRFIVKAMWVTICELRAPASVRTGPDKHEEFVVGLPGREDGIHSTEVRSR